MAALTARATLSKCLLELQEVGDVERVSIIEGNHSKSVYRLAESIVSKVPDMFEEPKWGFAYTIKDDEQLTIEQLLVRWFNYDVYNFMHAARKIMSIKNADLTQEKKSRYIQEWISQTTKLYSRLIGESLTWIGEEGKESWEEVFGELEDEPLPLYRALTKYHEIIKRAEEKEEKEWQRKVETGEIEVVDAGNIFRDLKVTKEKGKV